MAIEQEKIAPGHNNVAGLLKWKELAFPLFYRYRFPVETLWRQAEGQHNNSLGLPDDYGRQIVVFTFGVLTVEEFALMQTFHKTEVTIYAYRKTETFVWGNFNGTFIVRPLTRENWRQGMLVNIQPEVWFLEAIP